MTLPLYFLDAIASLPAPKRKDEGERGMHSLHLRITQQEDVMVKMRLEAIINHPRGNALLTFIFRHSPFLTRLILQYNGFFAEYCVQGIDASFTALKSSLSSSKFTSKTELMKALRIAKSKASLLIATADITAAWPLEKVTLAMSEMAELCVQMSIDFLLRQAQMKGDIILPYPENPARGCGLFVLAMGKLGAATLNYSSDIDLIIFFDSERIQYAGTQNSQQCFSKLAQELVFLLQERTAEGYVFRVDLRLRPDPSSTPAAMSTAGAITYYETVGQNWERAALIQARPIAGDLEAGHQFLGQIAPFIWRKHLDFAAINDIQSIKRQMDAHTGATIDLPGHNIKTGLGGIREIEFFSQIHQLIWGGRMMPLRVHGTCRTLKILVETKLIPAELAQSLIQSYRFLRNVEHRLQMIDDQQTHSIPASEEARAQLAEFMLFPDTLSFEQTLLAHLHFVHNNFAESFRGQGSLGSDEGKLSFTGVENDPQTLETIRKMGYQNPASVSEIIQGWHRGTRRATRNKRARELITELTPTLLKELGATTQPDQAFIHFDEFLSKLPAGVQLFSLFQANPHLLSLIALIMGSAPAIAETLSKTPNLLDTLLTADFLHELPNKTNLFNELSSLLLLARDFEDEMDIIRRFKNEKNFQAGVQLIRHRISTETASHYLSDTAETCIQTLLHRVEKEFGKKHPELQPGNLAVIALGRLGARDLTFGSDIDLVFVYDHPATASANPVLCNRLSQRFISGITALTREGRLYEVDTRLRPSGKDGALAVSIDAFDKYFRESAWTFEFMALTRARVITGNTDLQQRVSTLITHHITQSRTHDALAQDIIELRARVNQEFGTANHWNLKYARGGLMDLDFLAQYFVLLHAHDTPEIITHSSAEIFQALMQHRLIDSKTGKALLEAQAFLNSLFALLRLCGGGILDERSAPSGLKQLIADSLQLGRFEEVKATLLAQLETVRHYFERIIKR